MKRIILFSLFVFAGFLAQSQTLFYEDFFSEANGATTGTATGSASAAARAWSINTGAGAPAAGSFDRRDYGGSGYERFTINQTGVNEGIWSTGVITIPAGKQVAVDISLVSYNAGTSDYVRAYYKLNGGPEVLFGSAVGGGDYVISQGASIVLSGTSVQIVVRGKENTAGNNDGLPRMMRFDNVEVTEITNLYSRNGGGNWGTNGTWSDIALNGTSCGCTPDNLTNVIVGNTDVVSITGTSTAVNITVQDGSTLRWMGNATLTAARGGSFTVSNTASVTRNGNADAQLIFPSPAPVALTVNSSSATAFAPGDVVVNGTATMTVSGTGNISLGDDFLINAAASITNNLTGTFTITDDINFNTDNATFTNNGAITAGDLVVNDNGDDGNVFTNAASRTLSVATINANSGNFTVNNSGTITQSANFSNIDAGSAFNNLSGATWNFAGGNFGGTATRLFCNNGTNTFNYNGTAQDMILPQDAYSNLTISTSGIKNLLGGAYVVNGNLTIQNTATLNSNSLNLSVGGDWTQLNTGSFSAGSGTTTVTFNGTSAQTISKASAGAQSFNNVTINKASGNVLLSTSTPTSITVGGTLTLTSGGLQINSGNILNVTNTATTAIGRTNGFIISEATATPYAQVIWTMGTGTGSYVIPFGTASGAANYIPFTFNITSAGAPAAGRVSVSTYPTATDNTPYPSGVWHVQNASGANNSANTVDRFWIITPTSYTTNPTASLTFTARAAEVGTIANLRPQRWNGPHWDLPLATASGPTATTGLVTGVSTFSPWAMSGNNSPLPVELKFFSAALKQDFVELNWQTTSERNNDFFTIERAANIEEFEAIGENIKGKGTTSELNTYSSTDQAPLFGRSYYRLKQTDFDGKFTYSGVQVIDYSGPQFAFLLAYPSPSKDRKITIEIKGLKETKSVPIQIVNAQGQKVMEKTLEVKTPGSVKEEIAFDSSLPAGLYIIKAGDTIRLTQKIVVE